MSDPLSDPPPVDPDLVPDPEAPRAPGPDSEVGQDEVDAADLDDVETTDPLGGGTSDDLGHDR